MPSAPHDENKGNDENMNDYDYVDYNDGNDNGNEGDHDNAGEAQPPFNPDDYPGWVLDEASGAWYYAGDGEEEGEYVEGKAKNTSTTRRVGSNAKSTTTSPRNLQTQRLQLAIKTSKSTR